jgi:hypothetical protein
MLVITLPCYYNRVVCFMIKLEHLQVDFADVIFFQIKHKNKHFQSWKFNAPVIYCSFVQKLSTIIHQAMQFYSISDSMRQLWTSIYVSWATKVHMFKYFTHKLNMACSLISYLFCTFNSTTNHIPSEVVPSTKTSPVFIIIYFPQKITIMIVYKIKYREKSTTVVRLVQIPWVIESYSGL